MLAKLVDEVRQLVRIPSISGDPVRAAELRQCADWLVQRLRRAGFSNALVIPGTAPPLVRATWRQRLDRPTLLVYGHYDVQPAGALGDWRTPPFEPVLDGEFLVGRGASDDKGPLLGLIFALESSLARTGALPLNVICVFEGEEEIGSSTLGRIMRQQPELLAADAALIADTRSPDPCRPAITCALRGVLSVELTARAAAHDLHAGHYGGAIRGAAGDLAALLACLHDDGGRVVLPDFYSSVRSVAPARRGELQQIGQSDQQILTEAGALASWGEPEFSLLERTLIRPALTITALASGHVDRARYVAAVPAEARARLDIRLVADQDPHEVLEQLERFVRTHAPRLHVQLVPVACIPSVLVDRRQPVMQAAVAACERGFGARPEFHRSGATIPVVSWLDRAIGMPCVLLGLSLADDRRHGPNERLHLPTLQRGVATAIAFFEEAANRLVAAA